MTDVWYAAYGSNLSYERFMVYIKGGRTEGAKRTYDGCRNPSPPLEDRPWEVPGSIHFGGPSTNWDGGGVAFLTLDDEATAKLRLYRVERDQFEDVVAQENGRRAGEVTIDALTPDLRRDLQLGWYSLVAGLGEVDDAIVLTLTTIQPRPATPPSAAYLRNIVRGLRESHVLSDDDIVSYLSSKGVLPASVVAALEAPR